MSAVDLFIIGIGVLAGCFLLFIWGELMDEHEDMEQRVSYLAPKICPVCDRSYDDFMDEFETGYKVFSHRRVSEQCVKRSDGTENTYPLPTLPPLDERKGI